MKQISLPDLLYLAISLTHYINNFARRFVLSDYFFFFCKLEQGVRRHLNNKIFTYNNIRSCLNLYR